MPPARKKSNIDPEERALDRAYARHMISSLTDRQAQQEELTSQDADPISIEDRSPQPQFNNQGQQSFINPNFNSHVPHPPAPNSEASNYSVGVSEFDASEYRRSQRESGTYSQAPVPQETQQNLPSPSFSRSTPPLFKRLDILLFGSALTGLASRIILNLLGLNYLYWVIIIGLLGGSLALIYFSKDPKKTRPFVIVAVCFLVGFLLGGFGT